MLRKSCIYLPVECAQLLNNNGGPGHEIGEQALLFLVLQCFRLTGKSFKNIFNNKQTTLHNSFETANETKAFYHKPTDSKTIKTFTEFRDDHFLRIWGILQILLLISTHAQTMQDD